MSQAILVTGATGKQGSAVVAALATLSGSPFTILALTRNAKSVRAQTILRKHPSVKLITGNLDDPDSIFANTTTTIWGVYSVQIFFGGGASLESEERQGKALVDSSLKNGVKFLVYSSVDRGGPRSDTSPCPVAHFESKAVLEKYLKDRAAGSQMQYAVIRPVFLMENLTDDMGGRINAVLWKNYVDPKRLQLVATSDIGYITAQAFTDPTRYASRSISLAGDEINQAEASEIWKQETGKAMPLGSGLMSWALLKFLKDIGDMFTWFREAGFGADIQSLRAEYPNLIDFKTWVAQNNK